MKLFTAKDAPNLVQAPDKPNLLPGSSVSQHCAIVIDMDGVPWVFNPKAGTVRKAKIA